MNDLGAFPAIVAGGAPNGSRRRQGVVRVVRDLRIDTVRATIFGTGRFSPLDFSVAGLV